MTEEEKKGPEFYGSATIGAKGQVVIPADLRKELNLESGDKIIFFKPLIPGKGFVAIKPGQLLELQGRLEKNARKTSED